MTDVNIRGYCVKGIEELRVCNFSTILKLLKIQVYLRNIGGPPQLRRNPRVLLGGVGGALAVTRGGNSSHRASLLPPGLS